MSLCEFYPNNVAKNYLIEADLDSFQQLWKLKTDWFEEPNIRRGGWSGVVKYSLNSTDDELVVFIKRQENHITRTLFHPIKGIATFQKEFHNIKRLNDKHIPTLELIYFGQREQQAILITKSLEGYVSLDSESISQMSRHQKQSLLTKIADTTRLMHHYHFQHNCFYPKHIFVKKINDQWDVRFIDLEKLKRTIFHRQAVIRDLFTLYRHADQNWTTKDRLYFFKAYVNETKLSHQSKQLWQAIANKFQAKHK